MNYPPSIHQRSPAHTLSYQTPKMAITTALLSHSASPVFTHNRKRTFPFSNSTRTRKPIKNAVINGPGKAIGCLLGAGLTLTLLEPASAAELPLLGSSLQLSEPANALSLPTWAIHVSSVVEWITAMALVWQYGEKSGFESWKGLSWGMSWNANDSNSLVTLVGISLVFPIKEVRLFIWHDLASGIRANCLQVPLLGGAFCACTWHFFYNSESLEVLVALQAALTVIGNATMCYAAYRIYKLTEESSQNL